MSTCESCRTLATHDLNTQFVTTPHTAKACVFDWIENGVQEFSADVVARCVRVPLGQSAAKWTSGPHCGSTSPQSDATPSPTLLLMWKFLDKSGEGPLVGHMAGLHVFHSFKAVFQPVATCHWQPCALASLHDVGARLSLCSMCLLPSTLSRTLSPRV